MIWTCDMYFPVCLEIIVNCLMIMSFSGEESHNTSWLGNGRWSSILSYLNVLREKQSQVYVC